METRGQQQASLSPASTCASPNSREAANCRQWAFYFNLGEGRKEEEEEEGLPGNPSCHACTPGIITCLAADSAALQEKHCACSFLLYAPSPPHGSCSPSPLPMRHGMACHAMLPVVPAVFSIYNILPPIMHFLLLICICFCLEKHGRSLL